MPGGEADKHSSVQDMGRTPAKRGAHAMHSRSMQIAKPNCSTGKPSGMRGQCCARPAPEHTIWQSEVDRKGVAGDTR